MKILQIHNPFNAPVFFEETVTSTMDVSRQLAEKGEPCGSVIIADFQEQGRGRIPGRKWQTQRAMNLSFTILLRYSCIEEIPPALTLRAGLAAALAIEKIYPSLTGKLSIKWPNDLLIGNKKTAGILCESDGKNVFLGIGINVMQIEFPPELKEKATSLTLETGNEELKTDNGQKLAGKEHRYCFNLLEIILKFLFNELENKTNNKWKDEIEKRLYKKNENVVFIEGAADSKNEINGLLTGISENGELLIIPEGQTEHRNFITGELKFI